jgi:hypothetical protein
VNDFVFWSRDGLLLLGTITTVVAFAVIYVGMIRASRIYKKSERAFHRLIPDDQQKELRKKFKGIELYRQYHAIIQTNESQSLLATTELASSRIVFWLRLCVLVAGIGTLAIYIFKPSGE